MNRTTLSSIELDTSSGVVFVKFHLETVDDVGDIVSRSNHRTSLESPIDVIQWLSIVSDNIVRMGFPPISQIDIDNVKSKCVW